MSARAETLADPGLITLTQAAQRLRKPYRSALDLVLTGRIQGEQDPISGRWRVDRASVEALCATL